MRSAAAEAIGTFALVFVGTGAIVVDQATAGDVSHVGVSLAFGLVIAAMIYAVGDVSGAHFNPAVTLGFWAARRLPGRRVLPYVGSQCAAALLASGSLRLLFPADAALGMTHPSGPPLQSFVLELVLTFFLMFVILGVTVGPREKSLVAGVAIGATVALGSLFGGPISGASMNPARSFGPAVVTGELSFLWLYALAPAAGALLAVAGCRCARGPQCCTGAGLPPA